MKIRFLFSFLAVAGLWIGASGAGTAPALRAAYVFSDWSGRCFEKEFDAAFKKTGCAVTKFENVRLKELTARLDAFDLVVAGSVANYTHTVDLGELGATWRAWLEKGGLLLVVDANYGSVLGPWVGRFGADCACGTVLCSAHTKRTPEMRAITVRDDPLLHLEHDLATLIRERGGHWSHLTRLGEAWVKSVLCADGKPLFAYREVGKGGIVLTAAASLSRSPLAVALLTNVRAWKRLRDAGVRVRAFAPDHVKTDDARRGCRLIVACDEKTRARLTGVFTFAGPEAVGSVLATATPGADGTYVFTCEQKTLLRGKIDYAFELKLEGRPIARFVWHEQVPPALDVRLARKHLYPGDALGVRAMLHPQKVGRDRLLGIEWSLDGGTWQRRAAADGSWTIPVASLAPGRHELRTRLAYAEDFVPKMDAALDWGAPRAAEFFVHGEPKYRMRADHVLLENGKPFFPLGFYNVSWTMPDAERLKMVENVSAWGYNTVHVGMRGEEAKTDGYGAFLDACAKLGVRVITEFGEQFAEKTVARYRGKSAVLAWNPGDEPAPKGLTPATMFGRYDRFKQLDPDHLAYTVICVPSQYANYAAGTDVLAPDPYPVPRASIAQIYTRFKAAKAAADAVDTALWCVGQAFGGQRYDKAGAWPREPTPDEFRGMSYLALMAGVKGIIYYVYDDGSFRLLESPALLAAAKAFPAELKTITPFVLEGRCRMLVEGVEGVYAAEWTRGSARLFTAVNTRAEPSAVTVPSAQVRILHGAAQKMQSGGGATRVTLGPLARLVAAP